MEYLDVVRRQTKSGHCQARGTVEATTNNSIQRAELTLEFEILIEL